MIFAPTIVRVLERREQKLRADVARLARKVAEQQDNLATIDDAIAAVERRSRENANARFSSGARSVADLLALEQNSQSLRAGRAQLEVVREKSIKALATLVNQQRALAQEWRKEEARLDHVNSLAKRERIRIDVRQFEADDEAFMERYAADGRS